MDDVINQNHTIHSEPSTENYSAYKNKGKTG
jgi:hypothetical protein